MTESLSLTSPAFDQGGKIPLKYTVDGGNVSPPLTISGVSPDAESLVLILDDPDAATDPHGPGRVYDHWVVFNIPASTTDIPEGKLPHGAVQGQNGSGQNKYSGPAPPIGSHRYFFRLYALGDELLLEDSVTKADVLAALKPVLLAQTELVGTYQRQTT